MIELSEPKVACSVAWGWNGAGQCGYLRSDAEALTEPHPFPGVPIDGFAVCQAAASAFHTIALSADGFDLRFQVEDMLFHVRAAPLSLRSELRFKFLKLFLKRVALLLETLDFASASLKLVRDGLGKGVLDFTLLTLLLLSRSITPQCSIRLDTTLIVKAPRENPNRKMRSSLPE